MHGYELRKRLNLVLGSFRALSYGSLYPCLKSLVDRGWIAGHRVAATAARAWPAKRARIVYQLTADGKEHLAAGARLVRPGRLGGRELRRPVRLLRADRRRDPAPDPRGSAHAA